MLPWVRELCNRRVILVPFSQELFSRKGCLKILSHFILNYGDSCVCVCVVAKIKNRTRSVWRKNRWPNHWKIFLPWDFKHTALHFVPFFFPYQAIHPATGSFFLPPAPPGLVGPHSRHTVRPGPTWPGPSAGSRRPGIPSLLLEGVRWPGQSEKRGRPTERTTV